MAGEDSKASVDRAQTDESLRTERRNVDQVVAERQANIEDDADRVVDRAREQADAVLHAARDEADRRSDQSSTQAGSREILAEERIREDEALDEERATADEALRRERERNARVLMALLPLERDATDRYLMTERLRSDDALSNRDSFLGIVSHDLRDLLGGVVTTAGLLSKQAPETEEGAQTRRAAERLQRYAARMNRLIGDLVDVVSIDAGKLAVSPVRGDLAGPIEEAVETFQVAAAAKQLSLAMDVAERPLPADFDYERMLQLFANLITNAIKFTPAGGAIRVHAARVDEAVHLSVSDTGSGIPPDLLEAVFERFRQATENDRRGLGLGLYISRRLVEAHGGTIWAESGLGEGTVIHFTIPSTADGPTPPASG